MTELYEVLPLVFTMVVGLQMIVPILLITSNHPIKSSVAYILAIALATFTGVFIAYFFSSNLKFLNNGSDGSSDIGNYLKLGLGLLLVALSIRTYVNRKTAKPPKWLETIQTISAKGAFKIGLTLIFLMPGDIFGMVTVGLALSQNQTSIWGVLVFVLLTAFCVATPLLCYLIFKEKAVAVMPKINKWIDNNSWVVTLIANLVFIALIFV